MILVTGGTGFVGRAIVRELHRRGHHARVLARHPESAAALRLQSETGCTLVAGSVTDPSSLQAAMTGVTGVIHLVGIIFERGSQTFSTIHAQGTRNLVDACHAAGVRRLLHMSASGTREHAVSAYHRTKWQGECAVRASGLDWTIFRPAVIYGPGDGFCSIFVRQMTPPLRWLTGGIIPMVGDGTTLMQPVHVDEVAGAFARALDTPASIGKTFELGGPPLPFRVVLETLARQNGVRIHPLAVPVEFAILGAWFIEAVSPWKIPTPGHVAMLEEDQQADTSPAAADLDFHPLPFAAGLARHISDAQP
ncbi:MAG: complex I NDUFA9 subunit family protein [Candidatus Methylacidiphilales bacterium]|nr:complex I NDUFA9 subunit family protein [Candidatus Methylacidiphilales bacterium]